MLLQNCCHLQSLRRELDAIAAGTDLETLAAGDGGLSAGTYGADADPSNEVSQYGFRLRPRLIQRGRANVS